jgi:small subunit ribosomal protein S2
MDLLPKKESAALRREKAKLGRNLAGILDMDKIPAAMIVVDMPREEIAVKEARRLRIPVIALADTNADPDDADIAVPCNDDAIRSIRAVMEPMAEAIEEGRRRGPAHPPAHTDKPEQVEKTDKKKKERTSKGKEAALTA